MWVAKGKQSGKIYSRKFKSIYSCRRFIDSHLSQKINYENTLFKDNCALKLYGVPYDSLPSFYQQFSVDLNLALTCCQILCWNVEQNRFCTGFDF